MDQQRLSALLAEFARTLGEDFSIQDILDRLARGVIGVIDIDGAGVLLLDDESRLRFVSATDERILVIQKLQLELGEGPCIMAFETGEAVMITDLASDKRFEQFSARALEEGLGAVYTFPLRLDGRSLGALDLYSRTTHALSEDDVIGAQIIAEVAAAYIFNAQARANASASAAVLHYRAMHDPLTKLANRALLEDRLDLALTKSRRSGGCTGLMFLDLDRFKTVNDTYGHMVGDRLLIAVARRLSAALRPGDTLARIAGDEFVVVCEDLTDLEQAEQLAARVHAILGEAPFVIEPHSISITASVGVAVSADPGDHAADLLLHADAALYEAKLQGGGRSGSATKTARTETHRRLSVERDLREAIDADQLALVYQPIFDPATGRAAGIEALLRWSHPQLGEIAPPTVVASAERTGLILDLGAWAMRNACEQLRRWNESGVDVGFLCVNVAAHEFTDPSYCETVEAILERSGIEPGRLCLEVTESVLIDDVPGALTAFDGLKRVGVRLALDDFGTGYSSLSYLKRFPVDIVKIDRSFVSGISAEPLDQAIVAAVVALAHETGMTVIAEGVEDASQLAAITRLGCDLVQGYLFARPMPPEAVSGRLELRAR